MYPTASVIVSTYNWPQALALTLKSLAMQKVLPTEVLVADDGSGPETKAVVDAFAATAPFPVIHIWQPDEGFQLSRIRNKAIARATGQYIIQLDGDVIVPPHFVHDHLAFARPNSVVRASRIYINEKQSFVRLSSGNVKLNACSNGISNRISSLRLPFLWPFFATKYKNKGLELYEIHGCNMAFWKADAIEVNGYNEGFVGWGFEDKEFLVRLLNAGKQKRFLKLGGAVFHIYHPENARNQADSNAAMLDEAIKKRHTYCTEGLNKYD